MKRILITLLLLSAVQANAQNDPAYPYDEYVYATRGDTTLKAFVFSPENQAATELIPAIVIFHGGGWTLGEASWCFGLAEHYAELGMVAVAVQYRLADRENITPIDAVSDARDVIAWVRSQKDVLHVDPDRIAAYGWSAGAHLAMSAAVFGDTASTPNALVLVSPALRVEKNDLFVDLLLDRADVESVSPYVNISEGLPPTIILQGCTDTVTPLIEVYISPWK